MVLVYRHKRSDITTIMDHAYNTRLVLLINTNIDNYINTQITTFETKDVITWVGIFLI
jgi:hypothetical protein